MRTTILLIGLMAALSSCVLPEDTFGFDLIRYNPQDTWANDFDYPAVDDVISSQKISGEYDKLLPVGNHWTYGTIQPEGSGIALVAQDYIVCSTPARSPGLTSKAQVARKLPPFGVLEGYEGLTAIHREDTVRAQMDLYLPSAGLTEGNVYFLDFEDSINGSLGVRFFLHGDQAIGVNIDKIRSQDTVFYAETTIPTDQWFRFELEMLVGEEGSYDLWIDGVNVLSLQEQSFRNDLYFYDAVMTGITGTIKDSPSEIWVDNFFLQVQRGDY
jgi:hypothetical protein